MRGRRPALVWGKLVRGAGAGAALALLVVGLWPGAALANGGDGGAGEPTSGRVAVAPRPVVGLSESPTDSALPSFVNTLVSRTANGSVAVYGLTTENIGGFLTSAPSATYLGLTLHVVGSNAGTIYHNSETSGTWSGWTPIGAGSDPVVVAYGDEVHVVYRAANGNVMDTWLDGVTWHTANLGGTIVGTPVAVTYGDQFQVFGANGGIVFQKWFWPDAFTWYGWTAISTGSDPSAALFNDELHVLSRAAAGNVLDRWYGAGVWTTQNLDGIITGTPVAAGLPDVFRVVGANSGVVYQRTYSAGLWSPWVAFSTGGEPVATASTFLSIAVYSVYSRRDDGTILQSGYLDDIAFQRTFPG